MKEIPISEAKKIAQKYNYEQVIILGLKKVNSSNFYAGWGTTYNINQNKCGFLGKVANILAYNFRAFYSNEKLTEDYNKKITKGKMNGI